MYPAWGCRALKIVVARAAARLEPVAFWRWRAPRQSSCTMTTATKAHTAKQISAAGELRAPASALMTSVAPAAARGQRERRFAADVSAPRHGKSEPAPVSTSSSSPIGTMVRLKKVAVTLIRWPTSHSERVGKRVATSTRAMAAMKTQLPMPNIASRERSAPTLSVGRSSRRRQTMSPKLKTRMAIMKPPKTQARWMSLPKAWTDCTMPDLVRKVPTMVRKNDRMTSA